MTFKEVAESVFGHAQRENGWNGETIKADFALVGADLVEVHPCGWFRTGIKAESVEAAAHHIGLMDQYWQFERV